MNAIVLTAVLSALNSGLYAASRMLFALTRQGHAPKSLVKVTKRGVPVRATLIGTVVALASIVAAYISPDDVFEFLISSYGAVALFVYLFIALAQVRLRRKLEREDPDALVFKMWLFPWLSYLTIAGMVAVIAAMGISRDTRSQFLLSLLTLAAVLGAYGLLALRRRRIRRQESADAATNPPAPAAADVRVDPVPLPDTEADPYRAAARTDQLVTVPPDDARS